MKRTASGLIALAACLVLSAAPVAAQVAGKANERYQSKEGRDQIVRTLTAPDRDNRQKPDELVQALAIRPGSTVVDLGTGAGYMLPYLSKAVGPQGKVIAQDIFSDFLDRARQKAADEQLANTTFVEGTNRDPALPAGVADLILTLDAYHHFDYPDKMLAGIHRALNADGRLAIVDFYKSGFRDPDHIRLDVADVIKEVEANGFRLLSSAPLIPKSQFIAIFAKK